LTVDNCYKLLKNITLMSSTAISPLSTVKNSYILRSQA
jgi:hypothetical protein